MFLWFEHLMPRHSRSAPRFLQGKQFNLECYVSNHLVCCGSYDGVLLDCNLTGPSLLDGMTIYDSVLIGSFPLAFFYCEVDGSSLCLQCDMIVHVGGKRTHERYIVLRQRIQFPRDKPGRMEDPTENRRGENQQLGLMMGENQQNHRVPESATNAIADGHANTKTNMMDLNMQPHQIHEQASNNQIDDLHFVLYKMNSSNYRSEIRDRPYRPK
ncbi:hypothetical protein HYC85_018706 [Camellia sinensis]|uniref:B box-type domain-containing protein n=1 Tax=Camellia sinensis TaxID=4442 RepID=A0A7J7GV31_CAMSI|nr:hypothetical protein HYC85_018706 [Camellia sinensis]